MAWHLMGSLSAEKYDKNYGEREIVNRITKYLLNHKHYLIYVIIFSLSSALVSILIPVIMAIGLEELFINKSLDIILFAAGGYLIFLVLEWILTYVYQVNSQKLQANVTYDLRKDLYSRINRHEIAFFDQNKTGKVMARVSGDTFQLGGVLTTLVDLGAVILRAVLILGTILLIDWQLTLISLIIFPILFGSIYLFRKVFKRYSLLQRRAEATLNAFVDKNKMSLTILENFKSKKLMLMLSRLLSFVLLVRSLTLLQLLGL
jgi:ATP-binding cassette subfamily B protein